MFKNLRLAQQLGFGFSAVLALLIAVSVTAFWAISSAGTSLTRYEGAVKLTEDSWEQQDDVSQLRNNLLSNISSHDKRYLEAAEAITAELRDDIERQLAQATSTEEKKALEEMGGDINEFADTFAQVEALWSQRNDIVAPMVEQGAQMIALMDEVIADFTRDENVALLSQAAGAQKDLIFGRLYVVKYLEDASQANFATGVKALGDGELGALIAALATQVQDPEIQQDLAQFESLRSAYVAGLHRLHDVLTQRQGLLTHALDELGPELTGDLEQIKQAAMAHQVELEHEANETSQLGLILVSVLSLAAILLGGAIAVILPRAIRKPIGGEPREIQGIAEQIAKGDLTVAFDDTGTETGIYAAMRGMTRQLTGIVGEVTDSAGNVSSASSQIAAGSQELSQRTEEQASSLEETAASIEEMTSTIKQNADNAQEASQLAEGARDNALKGGEVVKRAQLAMNEISTASNQIKEIIEVIEGISFQTNLLSLNASVEAARAGEQGRGFAVVAGEVGKLASKSSDAAKDIKGLINSTVDKVEAGAALVGESGSALEDIITSVNRVTDIVAEIAAASQEQAAGIGQINKAVTQMDEVTQHNSSLVEETASAAEALNEQAAHLKRLISYFRIGTDQPHEPERPAPRAPAPVRPAPARPSAPAARDHQDGWQDF